MRWKDRFRFGRCRLTLVCLVLVSWPCHAESVLSLDEAIRLSQENQPYQRQYNGELGANTETRFLDVNTPAVAPFKTALETLRNEMDPLTRDILNLGDGFLTPAQRIDARMRRVRMMHYDPGAAMLSRQVIHDTATAWLNLYEAEHALVLEQSLQQEYANAVAAADISYRAGKGMQGDVWKAEDALNASRDREIELKNRVEKANADLKRWIGEAEFTLDEKIDLKAAPPLGEMIERIPALPQHAPYAMAKSTADDEMRLVEGIYKPDPKVEAYPEQNILVAMRELRDGITFQVVASLRELRAELRKAYADWQAAEQRRDLYEKTTLPNAARRLQAVTIDYRSGKADFSALLEARRNDIEARMQQLHLKIAAAMARIELKNYE